MIKLAVNKKKALNVLTNKVSKGKAILNEFSRIKSSEQYDLALNQYDKWWNSIVGILKAIFDSDTLANDFKANDFIVINKSDLQERIDSFYTDLSDDLTEINEIINNINQGLYDRSNSFDFSYDSIVGALKKNKVIAVILVLFAIIVGGAELIHKITEAKKDLTESPQKANTPAVGSRASIKDSTRNNSVPQDTALSNNTAIDKEHSVVNREKDSVIIKRLLDTISNGISDIETKEKLIDTLHLYFTSNAIVVYPPKDPAQDISILNSNGQKVYDYASMSIALHPHIQKIKLGPKKNNLYEYICIYE